MTRASGPARPAVWPVWLLLALLLGGCAGRPVLPPEPADAELRRQALLALPGWVARGRIAVRSAETGGQASFAWSQQADATRLRVSGPFGAGAWEIDWNPVQLTVRSARGETRADYEGPDAVERFLAEELGWSWPVANVRYWLLGLAGTASPAGETRDADGRLAFLAQDGWRVSYEEYRLAGGWWMPRRLSMENGQERIRVIIDGWDL